jgi:DNA-binding GntR family transcriptional regulator
MAEKADSSASTAYREISRALLEGHLKPGMPLRERQLAEIFETSRGAIRKALLRLGNEGKLQIFPNRGAFVLQPTSESVRRAYDARKAVEIGLVALLATRITDAQIEQLERHTQEQLRSDTHPREKTVVLSGEFHSALVRMIDSPELEAIIERLVSRTRILVALFEKPQDADCGVSEHEEIIRALKSRDPSKAMNAMLRHLSHVEERILSHVEHDEKDDLQSILRLAFGKQKQA